MKNIDGMSPLERHFDKFDSCPGQLLPVSYRSTLHLAWSWPRLLSLISGIIPENGTQLWHPTSQILPLAGQFCFQ